jgi:hypothetical protein
MLRVHIWTRLASRRNKKEVKQVEEAVGFILCYFGVDQTVLAEWRDRILGFLRPIIAEEVYIDIGLRYGVYLIWG